MGSRDGNRAYRAAAARRGLERAVPMYMSTSQLAYWRSTHLTIDVVPGRGAGFSVEAPEGVRFIIRSRMLTEPELAVLEP